VIFDCYSTLIEIKTDEEKEHVFRNLSLYLQYYGANMSAENLKAELELEKQRQIRAKKDQRYPEIDLELAFAGVLAKEELSNPFLAESCCKLFRLLSREHFQPFPDTLPVLREMKEARYPLAVVSDAQKVFCLEEGNMLGLNRFFDHIVVSTQFGFRKPDHRLFAIACALLEVAPQQAVYVGDNPETDVQGAKEIGMEVVLVDRGKKGEKESLGAQPDLSAGDLWETWAWIRNKTT